MDEAHVEHVIGFVEHENLDFSELQRTLADEVQQAPRRRDEHIDAAFERLDLLADADAPNTTVVESPRKRP